MWTSALSSVHCLSTSQSRLYPRNEFSLPGSHTHTEETASGETLRGPGAALAAHLPHSDSLARRSDTQCSLLIHPAGDA